MKTSLLLPLLCAVFTAFLTSCGTILKTVHGPGYSTYLEKAKPLHIGEVTPVRHGAYHAQAYKRSLIFMATTRIISPSQVEVFDVDHNGRFDSVFIYSADSWSFGTTNEFAERYKTKSQTVTKQEVSNWIREATTAKKAATAIQKQKALEEINKQPDYWSPQ
jgi:hypothetical protein